MTEKWIDDWEKDIKKLNSKIYKKPCAKDIKKLFELDNHSEFYAVMCVYDGKIVDVFCTDHEKIADFAFKQLKKEEDKNYKVIYKKCNYTMWRYKLFDIAEDMIR